MTVRRTTSRGLAVVVVCWGAGLLLVPRQMQAVLLPGDPQLPTWVTRVLGGRLVIQHTVVARWPTTSVVVLGSASIDAAHAMVMTGLAARGGRHRTAATMSAAMAAAAATAAWSTRPR